MQNTPCWICVSISIHLHLQPRCWGIIVMQPSQNRHRDINNQELEEPWLDYIIGTFIGKTRTLELGDFRLHACTLGRNSRAGNARKSVAPQGFFSLNFICNIFCVIFLDFGTVLEQIASAIFELFRQKWVWKHP